MAFSETPREVQGATDNVPRFTQSAAYNELNDAKEIARIFCCLTELVVSAIRSSFLKLLKFGSYSQLVHLQRPLGFKKHFN